MIEIVYTLSDDGREHVHANRQEVGTVARTRLSVFRWSAWRPDGRLVTSRARNRTDATEALLEQIGALG